ncbi:MAG: ATP-binding protein [Phycisphaerales bacterium]|nr:MAG: ATP-binding protein [Phycisphaerales bacterium]
MIQRRILPVLRRRLKDYPAVALVGPRQSGKTTLARSLGEVYYDLEQEADRLRLDLEWNQLVAGRQLVVLDEAQVRAELFPRLRGAIDERRQRKGRFLLLGSVSPSLMVQVSESLAGRLALVELTPLLFNELTSQAARTRRWRVGGFPEGGVLSPRRYPQWGLNYLTLLAQRDLPSWGLSARPQVTMRMLRMLAALHGQMWNASQLGASLGLSYQTVNTYAEYLEGAFLIRRLPPLAANLRKRLVKSPKVYWRDSGLLHAVLNVADQRDLLSQPWVGASWEGFVIEQIIGTLQQVGRPFEAFFFRTSDRHEIDLVLDFGRSRWAIEVKLSSSPGLQDMTRLNHAADMIGADRRILISQTRQVVDEGGQVSCNLEWLLEHIEPV